MDPALLMPLCVPKTLTEISDGEGSYYLLASHWDSSGPMNAIKMQNFSIILLILLEIAF